jgi:NitT/TauT family transport system ATP-binding protein
MPGSAESVDNNDQVRSDEEGRRKAGVVHALSDRLAHPLISTQVLELEKVKVDYRSPSGDPFCAVHEVSFTVAKQEMISVVGPSGCGKSTLLSAVAGLVPCSSGVIKIDGDTVDGPGANRAVVFQKAALLPWRTALDNVAYPLNLRKMPQAKARELAAAALARVGLSRFEQYYPHQLSGGMQQRVNLARALVTSPKLLLLDEPFAAVDAQMRELLQDELLRLLDDSGMTGVFVTHQIDEAVLMGDRIVVLSGGPEATVRRIIDVPLGRPRAPDVRTAPEFVSTVAEVWDIVRREIMEGLGALGADRATSGAL